MPFKSKAQRRKFYAMESEGKMDKKTIGEFESKTPSRIPERVKAKEFEKKLGSAKKYWQK